MLVDLPVPTWESWQAQYREEIRVKVWWDELQRPKPKIKREYFPAPLFYPWFDSKRQWRSGDEPKRVRQIRPGTVPGHCLVLAPAVLVPRRGYLLLDHCHRIRDLRPRVLAVDALIVKPEQLKAFADLLGKWHE